MCSTIKYAIALLLLVEIGSVYADAPRVYPPGSRPDDSRLAELKTLNGYFPFKKVTSKEAWQARREEIRRRILLSQGLWPEPTKSELNAVVHGKLEFDDYSIEKVYFESIPGHFVTGSLYRPKGKQGPFPAILSPHGHWREARFYDAGEKSALQSIAIGAERFISGARNPIQARCVQLARMGCIVFFYDMTGNCDSIQIGHRPNEMWDRLDTKEDWGFFSVQAELRLQNMMGLQTWNSVRAIDFLETLPDVDAKRIGVTGASGGGTQSMIIAAIDDRIAAAMPCVMVSTAMQGGCTCENAPYMRIDQGNVDIAAAIAPRPLSLTAADDWTVELKTKGYPDLLSLYTMLGKKKNFGAVFHTHFKHNYNHVNRTVAYKFFNQHFKLGLQEPVLESDFQRLTAKELSVWDDEHPAPAGDAIGDSHEIRILRLANGDAQEKIRDLVPSNAQQFREFAKVIGGAWETIIARRLEQVGNVEFDQISEGEIGGVRFLVGKLNHASSGEQLPAIRLSKPGIKLKGTYVWVPERGKAELFNDSKLRGMANALIESGYAIVSADLSGQGEFAETGAPVESQRMWFQGNGESGWQRFAGYTYGYNHSLFVKRAHDVLTLIKWASQNGGVRLIGVGESAGPVALAARSQSGDAIEETYVDAKGFRFQNLTRHDDPMFVSGAVRYLDVEGLLSLCAPHKVSVRGVERGLANRVYAATESSEHLESLSGGIWSK